MVLLPPATGATPTIHFFAYRQGLTDVGGQYSFSFWLQKGLVNKSIRLCRLGSLRIEGRPNLGGLIITLFGRPPRSASVIDSTAHNIAREGVIFID